MTGNLNGKLAMITGAASGLGRAMALRFAEEGAALVLTDMNADGLSETATACTDAGAQVTGVHHDVTSTDSWAGAYDAAFAEKPVDVLVNNAGVAALKSFEEMTLEDFQAISAVNLQAPFKGMKLLVERLRAASDGQPVNASIVNITSIASLRSLPGWSAYGASKAALKNLTKALAVELGLDGDFIRVNAIAPGPARTPMTEFVQDVPWDERDHSILKLIPLKRYGQPDEVAKAAVYLASDRSKFMTGHTIEVDGGWGGV